MGNLNVLLRMVEKAAEAGCSLIKMQKKMLKLFIQKKNCHRLTIVLTVIIMKITAVFLNSMKKTSSVSIENAKNVVSIGCYCTRFKVIKIPS